MLRNNFSLGGFNTILNDNSRCHDFQEALDLEIESFADYIRDATPDTRDQYVLSCVRTERCLRSLPFDYARIGTERYARTWSILNGYETYQAYRDELAETQVRESDFVERLYRVYKMQEYLQTYARRLVQVTLKEGNDSYQEKVPVFYNMPYLILAISAVFMGFVMFLTKILSNALVSPAVLLAQCARKIAKNDFTGEDPSVENRDEMGELVRAFNKMKRSTKGSMDAASGRSKNSPASTSVTKMPNCAAAPNSMSHDIDTLKENHRMSELLHREEIERVEMEKQLSGARLELLKSQINPHFLFNTLNMIACMAKLEEAVTTERMISSMGSLFRYNLKTSEQIVTLARELKVVQDYMYIQQMRFGSRILYSCDLKVDAEQAMIPAFTLQPVVENAMVHGLSKKEQGGRVHVRIWEQGNRLVISVADTGLGMSEERLAEVTEAMKERRTSRIGIGLGNIYKRIHMMYKQGEFRIASIEGRGTVIQMFIPQEKHNRGDK